MGHRRGGQVPNRLQCRNRIPMGETSRAAPSREQRPGALSVGGPPRKVRPRGAIPRDSLQDGTRCPVNSRRVPLRLRPLRGTPLRFAPCAPAFSSRAGNPFSESRFKTLTCGPEWSERFVSFFRTPEFCCRFFSPYNHKHYRAGAPGDPSLGAVDNPRDLAILLPVKRRPNRCFR